MVARTTIKAAFGKDKFVVCAACHGSDGKGSKALGAPNLTDDIWLHGSSQEAIVETILMGRKSSMPPHKDFLVKPRRTCLPPTSTACRSNRELRRHRKRTATRRSQGKEIAIRKWSEHETKRR